MAANPKSILFSTPSAGPAADAGMLVLRIGMGLALALAHGLGKVPPSEGFIQMVGGLGFPAPTLFAWLAALAEFAGGLLLVVGLLTRPVALFVTVHFILVLLVPHAGDSFGDRELPFLFMTWAATLLLTGPGRYSLDALIGGRNRSL